MSTALHPDGIRVSSGSAKPQSFAKLAELVQRFLGCEAAVLSVDDPLRTARRANPAGASERRSSAAFRQGRPAAGGTAIDLGTLTDPLVAGAMGMRFYAGLPLRDHKGRSIGRLAAIDRHERTLAAEELETLKQVASMASDLYEMQRLGRAA